jgi:hypothetical protein
VPRSGFKGSGRAGKACAKEIFNSRTNEECLNEHVIIYFGMSTMYVQAKGRLCEFYADREFYADYEFLLSRQTFGQRVAGWILPNLYFSCSFRICHKDSGSITP